MENKVGSSLVHDVRRIYWEVGKTNAKGVFAHVHLLQLHTVGTITAFQSMAVRMRATFWEAADSRVCPGTVFRSDQFCGALILTFDDYMERKEYPGWMQMEMDRQGVWEYQW